MADKTCPICGAPCHRIGDEPIARFNKRQTCGQEECALAYRAQRMSEIHAADPYRFRVITGFRIPLTDFAPALRFRDDPAATRDHGSAGNISRPATHVSRGSSASTTAAL